ncbi:MAG TPA: DNA mismatch endonuclease Vsr [Fibrobacteria bacterium]|nr:DNA mismatch endonuclease Vsr [Fibrobacteria bacterium]
MTDTLTPSSRSALMSRIRGKDTKPELVVRSLLHRMGFRFRLHRRDLPGSPDIVLPRLGVVVFVHGCFWHRHHRCKGATTPKSNADFWQDKFAANVERDKRNRRDLRRLGWKVVVVWECDLKKPRKLETKLRSVLV